MKSGATVIDMSSTKASEARHHQAKLAEQGIHHLDAPVSGGTKGAEAASLAIMVGGDEADLQPVSGFALWAGCSCKPRWGRSAFKLANQLWASP